MLEKLLYNIIEIGSAKHFEHLLQVYSKTMKLSQKMYFERQQAFNTLQNCYLALSYLRKTDALLLSRATGRRFCQIT